MALPDCGAEINIVRKPSGEVAFSFALFINGEHVATGVGNDVPEAAQWCARRLRQNLEQGIEVMTKMGLIAPNEKR